jgi:hypothetical protein
VSFKRGLRPLFFVGGEGCFYVDNEPFASSQTRRAPTRKVKNSSIGEGIRAKQEESTGEFAGQEFAAVSCAWLK